MHPFLIDLRAKHEETVNLGIRVNLGIMDGGEVIYLDKIESPHLLSMDNEIRYE